MKHAGWKRVDERAFEREVWSTLIALLQDHDQHDLARVLAMRASGERVRVAVVTGSAEHPSFEVVDNETTD